MLNRALVSLFLTAALCYTGLGERRDGRVSTHQAALAESLKALLAQKPLSKITISDITAHCGMNRMTFYYHFQDIYDLIDWICQEEGGRALQGRKDYRTWQEGFTALCHAVIENRTFIEGVYHSVQREQIEAYLGRVGLRPADRRGEGALPRLCHLRGGPGVHHEFLQACLCRGSCWTGSGAACRRRRSRWVGRVSRMSHGQLLGAIRNMAANLPNP